ncbi:MAG: response regulator [Deltaproteobacteria bacterium]|nr:response regulator [Deltaproteobacteria bacterium]
MAGKDTKRVLVVDDEETLTWSMTKTLAKDKEKYELIIANTGREALQALQKYHIDVVVTDIKMPDINGLDLLLKIREEYPLTKVLIMTAYGSPEVQKEATKRGSYYYIEKPFEISDIRGLILKALEEKRGGFAGQLLDLQLVDIIQMGCLGRFTMSLTVFRSGEAGLIYFKNGEIVHAEIGNLEGEEALYTMLGWKEGRFTSQMGISAPKETITNRWEHLLLEGMKRSDEVAITKNKDSSVLLQEVEEAFEDLGKEIEVKESLERVLRMLTSIDGYEKGICVDDKGRILTSDDHDFTEKDALVPLLMFTVGARLGKALGDTQPVRVNLGHKNNQSIIMRYNHLFLMVVLCERTAADEFYLAARNILERRLSRF